MKKLLSPPRATAVALAAASFFTAPALAHDVRDVAQNPRFVSAAHTHVHDAPYAYRHSVAFRTYGPVSRREARQAVRACSAAAHRFTRSRGGFTADYIGAPSVVRGPKNALRVTGVVRAERRNGFRKAEAVCTARNGNVLRYALVH